MEIFSSPGFLYCCLCVFVITGGYNANGQGFIGNVARDKPCTMSSTWRGRYDNQTPRSTTLAVDGNTYTDDAWCVHSGYDDRTPYWEVNLGRPYPIHKMEAYARYLFEHRMSNIVVSVDGEHCYTFSNSGITARTIFYCQSGVMNGTVIRLSKNTTNSPDYAINLCELIVWSCADDYWGSGCDRPCGQCKTGFLCDKVTGLCPACKPGYKPGFCTEDCDSGRFGYHCQFNCSQNCDSVCEKVNGHCTCKPGWLPQTCTTECPNDWWGQSCVQQCGLGCTNTCDKVQGTCQCHPGWYPPRCQQQCRTGEYGKDCGKKCSANCIGDCAKDSGHCACTPGFLPPLCEAECPSGTYGQDCKNNCSDHCMGGVCDAVTGHCTCTPGYKGDKCDQVCSPGKWGAGCQEDCGQCKTSTRDCHHVTGHCDNCYAYFKPPFCTECLPNVYGVFCDKNCSAQCRDACDASNGFCSCKAGYQPPSCEVKCTAGSYGDQCLANCGNCTSGELCDHVTGHCENGCMTGLAEPLCQQTIQSLLASENGEKGGLGVIVGSVVGAIVIIALVVVIVIIIRRRRAGGESVDSKTRTSNNNNKPSTLTMDNIYQNVTPGLTIQDDVTNNDVTKNDTKANGNKAGKSNGKPTAAAKPRANKTPSAPQQSNGKAVLYANVKTTVNPSPPPRNLDQSFGSTISLAPPTRHDSEDDLDVNRNDVYYNDVIYMTSEAACLRLDSVQQHLLDRLRSDDLDREFAVLEKGLTRDCKAGTADVNHYKNRFSSIVPYDDNRVVLHDAPHEGANDYVNASYIRGHQSDKAYIASQGPRPNTVADMWWMMWQERVSHIVMLTNLMEADKKKCEEYWPGLGGRKQYGAIDVSSLDEQHRADYVIRTFQIKDKSGNDVRKVTQYHYEMWPDHDVPLVTSVVDFWCTVAIDRQTSKSDGPLLVHCSAGVGRTGAFIALDSLIQQSKNSKSLDVQQTAIRLRHDRCNMIQTKSQYRLVYEAVLEAYTCQSCRVTMTSFDELMTSQVDPQKDDAYIDKEFKKLQQMRVLQSKPSYREAEKEENINKNRDVTILPDDMYLAFLTHHVRGRNQYINAVYATTFFRRKGCIMTQLPLKDTTMDFWRLVIGNVVNTVISLDSGDNQSDEESVYWPRQKGQVVTSGPFNVTLLNVSNLGECLTVYKLSVAIEGSQSTPELQLYRLSNWTKELPDDVTDLTQLLGHVTQYDAESANPAPIVLQCRDGSSKSGMVRALADVISRMTSEGHVDVYTAVKNVQNVRPQSILTPKHYRFVYYVIQRYAESSNIYQNT